MNCIVYSITFLSFQYFSKTYSSQDIATSVIKKFPHILQCPHSEIITANNKIITLVLCFYYAKLTNGLKNATLLS